MNDFFMSDFMPLCLCVLVVNRSEATLGVPWLQKFRDWLLGGSKQMSAANKIFFVKLRVLCVFVVQNLFTELQPVTFLCQHIFPLFDQPFIGLSYRCDLAVKIEESQLIHISIVFPQCGIPVYLVGK